MIIFAFIIPIVTCIILFVFFRRETVWWEYIIVFFPSLLGSWATSSLLDYSKIHDIRWTSKEVVKITHEDDWDEWVHRICTRVVRVGKTSHTVTYDCSHRVYHPDKWYETLSSGKTYDITKKEYDRIKRLWETPEIFLEKNRKFFRKDGDAQYYNFPKIKEKTETRGFYHSYKNYFQGKTSLYSIADVPDSLKLDLFEYPKLEKDQRFCLGWKLEDSLSRRLSWINSRSDTLRVFILVWKKVVSNEMFELQRRYWKNGNSNEVVFMISLNGSKVEGIESFSFSEEPYLENYVKSEIFPGDKWSPKVLIDAIERGIELRFWKPRNFEDYSYIESEFGGWDYFIVFIVTCVINFLLSLYVITNEINRW